MTTTMNVNAFRLGSTLAVRVRAAAGESRALRLALLLDISESMAGERLTSVKRTLAAARSLWQPEDRTTLVTFGERGAPVLVDHLMDAAGVETFYTAVDALHVDGCTNLSSGLEEVATAVAGRGYDALVILTDGQVNRGMTSTAGLQVMALGLGLPATTLGYGADHNRVLLRDLALHSHGSYVFCDSDETLPVAIGQLLAELRTRVVARASLSVAGEGWACSELGGAVIGSIVPDRDYWSVWTASADAPAPVVTFTADGTVSTVDVTELATDAELVKEQSLRARVAATLKTVADSLEAGRWADPAPVRALEDEISAESAEFRARGLVLRLLGELAAIRADLEAQGAAPASPPQTPPLGPLGGAGLRRMGARAWSPPRGGALMARLSSQTAYLSTQRGVPSLAPDDDMFSSPAVRVASTGVRAQYNQRPSSPSAHDPAPASPPLAPRAHPPPVDDEE